MIGVFLLLYFIQWNYRNNSWVVMVLVVNRTRLFEFVLLFICQTWRVQVIFSQLFLAMWISHAFWLNSHILSFNFASFVSASSSTDWPCALLQHACLLLLFLLEIAVNIIVKLVSGLDDFRILEGAKLRGALAGMAVLAVVVRLLVLIHFYWLI